VVTLVEPSPQCIHPIRCVGPVRLARTGSFQHFSFQLTTLPDMPAIEVILGGVYSRTALSISFDRLRISV
jgi:hypothetical protein